MKQQSKCFAVTLALACGLAAAGSAQAQSIMLSNVTGSSLGSGFSGGGGWSSATFSNGSSVGSAGTGGVEVVVPSSNGYGYTYFDVSDSSVGAVLLSSVDTQVTLTFTVNGTASNYSWLGVPFTSNDGSGSQAYPGIYSGSGNSGSQAGSAWNGNTASITWALNSAQLAAVQAGNDYFYGFSTGVNPSGVPATMDITFNSVTFSAAPTPEPATMALSGVGFAGLLIFRRRK